MPNDTVANCIQSHASQLRDGHRAHADEVVGLARTRSNSTYLECSCGFHIFCKCARGELEYLLATKQANQAQTQAYVSMAMWINATPQKRQSWTWECPKCEFNRDTGMAGWKRMTLAKAHAKVRQDMPKEVLYGKTRGLRDCFVDIGGVCASTVLPFIQAGGTKCIDTLKVAVWSVLMRVVAVPLASSSASVLKGTHARPISTHTITLLNAVSRNRTMTGLTVQIANCTKVISCTPSPSLPQPLPFHATYTHRPITEPYNQHQPSHYPKQPDPVPPWLVMYCCLFVVCRMHHAMIP